MNKKSIEYPFSVENFSYNGFMVESRKGLAPYRAKFLSWSNDPGVALCSCTDGKERSIPSCCLIGDKKGLPKQKHAGVLFGKPSKS